MFPSQQKQQSTSMLGLPSEQPTNAPKTPRGTSTRTSGPFGGKQASPNNPNAWARAKNAKKVKKKGMQGMAAGNMAAFGQP